MEEIKKLIKNLYNEDYNPTEIKSTIAKWVEDAMNEFLEEEYYQIIFDSPLGVESVDLLRAQGYIANWYGPDKCRGMTYVYIPKKDKEFNTSSFEHMLEVLEIKDSCTHIIVK